MNKHGGVFYFNRDLIDVYSPKAENEKFWFDVFSKLKFVPSSVTLKFQDNEFEYVGTSPLFREVNEDERFPEYTINIEESESGEISLDVVEANNGAMDRPFIEKSVIKRINDKR